MPPESPADEVRRHIRALIRDDAAQGRLAPLASYLERFSDHRELVEEAFSSCVAEEVRTRRDDPGCSVALPPARGEVFGRYRIIRQIGRGGQGAVYLARDESLGREVALKLVSCPREAGIESRIRFEREARSASRLDHPGIARVFEFGEERGCLYLAMEHVRGRSLEEAIAAAADPTTRKDLSTQVVCLDNEAPLAVDGEEGASSGSTVGLNRARIEQAAHFIEEVARALHVAHEANLIHRDIKPGNIMVRDDGTPCVLDFGLAREEKSAPGAMTLEGRQLGSPPYMSPEQVRGENSRLDRRTDLFSLGVTLYEACTLRRPFLGSGRTLETAILTKEPPHPRTLNRRFPADLAAIVLKALDKDPKNRYTTALALAEDLGRYRRKETISARAIGPVRRTLKSLRRNPQRTVPFAILALAAGTLAIQQSRHHRAIQSQRRMIEDLADLGRMRPDERRANLSLYTSHPDHIDLLATDPFAPEALDLFRRLHEATAAEATRSTSEILIEPRGMHATLPPELILRTPLRPGDPRHLRVILSVLGGERREIDVRAPHPSAEGLCRIPLPQDLELPFDPDISAALLTWRVSLVSRAQPGLPESVTDVNESLAFTVLDPEVVRRIRSRVSQGPDRNLGHLLTAHALLGNEEEFRLAHEALRELAQIEEGAPAYLRRHRDLLRIVALRLAGRTREADALQDRLEQASPRPR